MIELVAIILVGGTLGGFIGWIFMRFLKYLVGRI